MSFSTPRPRLSLLPLVLLLQSRVAFSDYTTTNTSALHDNSPNCSCYAISSGPDSAQPSYFLYHRFFDFRNLASGPGQFTSTPPVVGDTQDAGEEEVWDSDMLNNDAWNVDWGIQNWSKDATEDFPTRMVNSPANIYISQNDDKNDAFTWLTLRTSRLEDFQSAAEIESEQKNLMHASMRMYARVVGAKGAVAGFFTFFDDTNESDIEILTSDPPDKIRYTNQPALDKDGNEVTEASQAPDQLPAWDEWQTHRIDWLPKNSYWYLNEKQVAANTYSVPRTSSYLVLNMWSDGGEWSGNMSVGESAELQIQWIELLFNTSGSAEGRPDPEEEQNSKSRRGVHLGRCQKREVKGCEVVCRVDGVKELGTPEVVKSAAVGTHDSWGLLLVVGFVAIVAGL